MEKIGGFSVPDKYVGTVSTDSAGVHIYCAARDRSWTLGEGDYFIGWTDDGHPAAGHLTRDTNTGDWYAVSPSGVVHHYLDLLLVNLVEIGFLG
ncbi:hypothetical protein [Anaerobium acetethylicum]|uniref:Uncharacterized protein n=1 Tax=Anaerobium acetethylicum TaxID=1619234 RepID=A0A1D3TYK7_9FIRM|nr:hypothetical protein [Anaerobium acetethylicum]SCP99562.1 hypothetical protein SAMN05421730_104611 [Anaerobium acetethylicum]